MVERVLDAELPCAWVVADSVYGSDSSLRRWLEERRQAYVLGITSQFHIFDGQCRERVETIVKRLPAKAWKKLSCGAGTKGERVYKWTCMVLGKVRAGGFRHWLLARRSLEDPEDMAYFIVSAPKGTTLEKTVRVAGARWAIEECFEVAKGELGLDQYEVRSWAGWHRHITLVMWLQALLSVLRSEAQPKPPATEVRRKRGQKTAQPHFFTALIPLSVPEVRHLIWWLVWGRCPPDELHVIHWSRWRRCHQARARACHYRHKKRPKPHLQL